MLGLVRDGLWVVALLCLTAGGQAQTATQDALLTGTISGRVTFNGQPVPRIYVALEPFDSAPQNVSLPKAVTDAEGKYRLAGVPEGRYKVQPVGTAYTLLDEPELGQTWMKMSNGPGLAGLIVTVARGEVITGVDFALAPGGVLTGRVTDAEGWPVIEAWVSCQRISERGHLDDFGATHQTDDRGIYRIYGLPAGDYLISVRVQGGVSKHYPQTFHPEVTDPSRATPVTVAAGGETTGVDIRLGQPQNTHLIRGRVIDAATGRPVPGVSLDCFSSLGRQSHISSDSQGEFKLEACPPGRYTLEVRSNGLPNKGYYSDPTTFEVVGREVTDVKVKAYRGVSLSGVVVIEGADDPAILERLSQLGLSAFWASDTDAVPNRVGLTRNFAWTKIGPGGRFEFTGLRPVRVRVGRDGFPEGFSLLRVECHGVAVKDEIDLVSGKAVTDVRVVIAHGTGSIRGRARVEGGTLPDKRLWKISARRADGEEVFTSLIDASGHFWIKGLAPGEYEVEAEADYVEIPGVTPSPYPPPVKQKVRVNNGVETEVTLILDLGRKGNQ